MVLVRCEEVGGAGEVGGAEVGVLAVFFAIEVGVDGADELGSCKCMSTICNT